MKQTIAFVALMTVILSSGTVFASGIELQEQSAVAQGRVLAVRAFLEDPSTVFYNPAGLAYLDGFHFAIGDTLVFPLFNYSDARNVPADQKYKDASNENLVVPPPHIYAAWGTSLGRAGRIGVGAGFNYPFGLTLVYPDDFAGKYLAAESSLLIPEITLGVAYSPIPEVSFGAGFVMSPAAVYMKQAMGKQFGLVADDGSPIKDSYVELAGQGWGFGYTVGVQARPIKNLYMGATFRSPISIEMQGDAHFEIPGLTDKSAFPDQKVETAFQLPDIISVGVAYRLFDVWLAEIDFEYFFWYRFKSIPMTFPDDKSGALSQELAQDWENGWVIRFGNEFQVTPNFVLRGGVGYDVNPVQDENMSPMLPDADRLFLAVGAGYRFDFGLKLDASVQTTYFLPRTVTGEACTAQSSDPACFDENGDFKAFNESGQATWSGNRFPSEWNNFAVLVATTIGYSF